MTTQTVDLFTKEEHVVVAGWLGVEPCCEGAGLPPIEEALGTLGFAGQATERREEDAAVASIVLERIQARLPQWATVRQLENGEKEIVLARKIDDRRASRSIEVIPRHLLTINWADSGPGFSWPVAYYLIWVPVYDVYVVTQCADSPDMYGYCDFAIGHFPIVDNPVVRAAEVIKDDWTWSYHQGEQQRWAYLFDTGLIDAETADRLAGEVWEDEQSHETA